MSSGMICAVLSNRSATMWPHPSGIQIQVMKSCSERSARFFARKWRTDVRRAIPERIERQSAMYEATPVARATIQTKSCGSISGSVREGDGGQGRVLDAGGKAQPWTGGDRRRPLAGPGGEERSDRDAGRRRGRRDGRRRAIGDGRLQRCVGVLHVTEGVVEGAREHEE